MPSQTVRRTSHGEGSATLLLGEAGIGKTRLVDFAATAAERAGVRVAVGRALPEVLTSPLPRRSWSSPEVSRGLIPKIPFSAYVPTLATLVPHWRGQSWRAPQESPLVMAEAVLGALERFAPDGGLLFVLEDLHWADDATLAANRFLTDHVSATRSRIS